ncbi:hypothetical protein SAMN04487939_12271 [Lysobacter sp. yr284]|uniref:hypothetical protein n=1 Tax=Lysobacter sp. yr284 TaxID=1761791 RepID=UPI00089B0EB0|nr:hypothetical protein [Lysobacter sp. yr284]SDZ20594.1 hypothetical protein SAMN04487939_12271 [Lysobacter sp. yr284]
MPLSIRRAKARAAALLDALEVGETWDVSDAERAFNFERHLAALVARAPRGLRGQLLDLGQQVRDTSPTFARLYRSTALPGFAP